MDDDLKKMFDDLTDMMNMLGDKNKQSADKVEIRISMSRELFGQIRTAVLARYLSHGSINGLADSFLARFVEKVDAGEKEWEVKKK